MAAGSTAGAEVFIHLGTGKARAHRDKPDGPDLADISAAPAQGAAAGKAGGSNPGNELPGGIFQLKRSPAALLPGSIEADIPAGVAEGAFSPAEINPGITGPVPDQDLFRAGLDTEIAAGTEAGKQVLVHGPGRPYFQAAAEEESAFSGIHDQGTVNKKK